MRLIRAALFVSAAAAYVCAGVSALHAGQAAAPGQPTVWDGVYSAAQAERGRIFFSANCSECHGENLQGGEGKPLAGTPFWNRWRGATVGDLFTTIRTNMPFSDDGSKKGTLATNVYVDIVAHILKTNGLPAGMKDLTPTTGVSAMIVLQGGSTELPDTTPVRVVGCLGPRGAGGTWHLEMAAAPVRASAVGGAPDKDVALGTRDFELKFVLSSLARLVGHRVAVSGLLIGEGGVNGLNVSSVDSVSDTCN
jgi:quinoprotein glucose dehydrogenase